MPIVEKMLENHNVLLKDHVGSITLGNKDFGALDILTDASYLGSPHTQMNTHLAQSGQIFPQIQIF